MYDTVLIVPIHINTIGKTRLLSKYKKICDFVLSNHLKFKAGDIVKPYSMRDKMVNTVALFISEGENFYGYHADGRRLIIPKEYHKDIFGGEKPAFALMEVFYRREESDYSHTLTCVGQQLKPVTKHDVFENFLFYRNNRRYRSKIIHEISTVNGGSIMMVMKYSKPYVLFYKNGKVHEFPIRISDIISSHSSSFTMPNRFIGRRERNYIEDKVVNN
jgi:hypothetical protein